MKRFASVVMGLALLFATSAGSVAAYDTIAGMGFSAKHYPGYPYSSVGAYYNGSQWIVDYWSPWTYPSSTGTHAEFISNWGGYYRALQSIWWSYNDNTFYVDGYAYSAGVTAQGS